jgi:glycosyltransferase involved in cell wall biosynthesis
MATYNGAVYVERQLRSILDQLGPGDEVILVDDHSSDSTLEVIAGLRDERIRIFRNERNMGVARSFERAISLAEGEIIFLSDQDDIWHPEKVARMMDAFICQPEITLVLSDARVVDKDGNPLLESFFAHRGRFRAGMVHNLIKNKYLGCVMAFRQGVRKWILPFPAKIPQHDMWIGLVNAIYGKALFIDLPLVDYRRHGGNASSASSNRHGTLAQMILWRWQLIKSLCLMGRRTR